ncbi:MAG: hypothetical protein AAF985_26310, partial [Bacteroidota bacterium]
MLKNSSFFLLGSMLLLCCWACRESSRHLQKGDLRHWPYAPEPVEVKIPASFFKMDIPKDNPMTKAGIALGRRLFYDPILYVDITMYCYSCNAFSRI